MPADDMIAATVAETQSNAREIERLRERSHEYGNNLQMVLAKLEGLDSKLDATHTSVKGRLAELRGEVKEDLAEIKTQTAATNGHVADHDRSISKLQGGLLVLLGSGVLAFALERL
jgi:chromosome segregation ATPase